MRKIRLSEKMSIKNCQGSAVYEINIGGFIYVGSTKMVNKRIFNHRSALRSGSHICVLLQEAYNSSNEDDIEVSILNSNDVLTEEIYRTNKYKNIGISLNVDTGNFRASQVKNRISNTMKSIKIKRRKFNWYTNGVSSIQLFKETEVPSGFYKGRTL